MSYKIDEIQGIGPAYREKLSKVDIQTTEDLLKLCCDPKGRKTVSEKTGLSETLLLNWSNMADMMRISGIGPQYAELLEASGVDTVKELRTRKADNLAAKMEEVNGQKNLAKTSPSASLIQDWVEKAKQMEPTITH